MAQGGVGGPRIFTKAAVPLLQEADSTMSAAANKRHAPTMKGRCCFGKFHKSLRKHRPVWSPYPGGVL